MTVFRTSEQVFMVDASRRKERNGTTNEINETYSNNNLYDRSSSGSKTLLQPIEDFLQEVNM